MMPEDVEKKQPSAAAGAPPKTATSPASVDKNQEKTEKLKERSRLRYVKSSLH